MPSCCSICRWCRGWWRRWCGDFPPQVRATLRPDLYAAGYLGLLDAAERYRPSRGVPFGAFARIRIQGAALDALRQLDDRPRVVLGLVRRMEAVTTAWRQRHQRDPTIREVAQSLNMPLARVMEALVARSHPAPLEAAQQVIDERADPTRRVAWRERQDMIRWAFRGLSRRERRVWHHLYVEELTRKATGRRLGVSESRISQIHQGIMRKLLMPYADRDDA